MKIFKKISIGVVVLLTPVIIISSTSQPVSAATISVSSGNDGLVNNSQCQLSEAIININDQAQTHSDCPSGSGNDVIKLPEGTITLTADLPVLTKKVKVEGQGSQKTLIDGAGQYRAFLANGDNVQVEFSGLKFRAYAGRAIFAMKVTKATVHDVEIDGTDAVPAEIVPDDPNSMMLIGFGVYQNEVEEVDVSINKLYVHDLDSSGSSASFTAGVISISAEGTAQTINAKNITVSGVRSSDPEGQLMGVWTTAGLGGGKHGSIQGTYENITVENIYSEQSLNVAGFGLSSVAEQEDKLSSSLTLKNATIRNLKSANDPYGISGGIGVAGGTFAPTDNYTINLNLQNVIIADIEVGGQPKGCGKNDISALLGGGGSVNIISESFGGNIADTASCEQFFNNSADINNRSNLKDTLGTISSNGTELPTLPLLPGSPAIDRGVCEGAPNTDARGVSRPQGKSCDSGAYELEQAKMAAIEGIQNPKTGKVVFIDSPAEGSVVKQATLLEQSSAPSDKGYNYPLGLASFIVEGVQPGSTQTMNVYFETADKASSFVARKLNDITGEYKDLPGAVLTNETRNGKPVVKLSYQITDGGELDLDGAVNGTFTDPVGIAKQSSLVNTGVKAAVVSSLSFIIVLTTIAVYLDYRRHKAPLLALDISKNKELAKHYTFWHHIKVVTLPVMRYRVTFIVEKKLISPVVHKSEK